MLAEAIYADEEASSVEVRLAVSIVTSLTEDSISPEEIESELRGGSAGVTWALERAPNPRVIRVHTTVELTRATIEKCPPASPPEGLRSLLAVDGVRSVDLHRYRARLNLRPGCDAKAAWEGVARAIEAVWGAPAPLPAEPPPRAFEVAYEGPRIVAESPEMAAPDPTLAALLRVPGVAEAILEAGRVRVRPGRLFSWEDVEASVRWAVQP